MAFLLEFLLQESPPLDSAYSWFIAICGCLYLTFNMSFFMSFGVLYVLLQERYQVSKENASYPLNIFIGIFSIFALFSGSVHHRLKIRKTLFLASILCVIGSCLSVFNPINDPIAWLTVCMAIRGIGISLIFPPTMQLVSSHFEKHKAKALMIVTLHSTLAGLVLPSVVKLSAEKYGLESSWFIHAAVHCQTLLLAMIIRPRHDGRVKQQPIKHHQELELITQSSTIVKEDGENLVGGSKDDQEFASSLRMERKSNKEVATKTEENLGLIWSFIFREKTFYFMCSFYAIAFVTCIAVRTTIVDYGIDTNLDSNLNKYILEILSLGDLTRIPTAIFIDSKICYTETLIGLAGLVSALTIFLLTLTRNSVYVIVSLMYTFSYGVSVACMGPIYSTLGTSRIAVAHGLGMGCSGVFMFSLPSLIGLFRDNYKTYDYLYYLFSIANVFLTIWAAWTRKNRWFKHDK